MMNESVSTIMTPDVVTVSPDDPLTVVKDAFKNKRLHHVPVTDEDNRLVGLVTTSDLLWLNIPFSEYEEIRVSDVMTTKIAKLDPNAKIGTAAEIFLRNWFHGLPIVNDEDVLLGIVTSFDVLKYEFKKAYPGDDFPFNW